MLIPIFFTTNTMGQKTMISTQEKLISSTVKITNNRTDNRIMQGTGFFYEIEIDNKIELAIVTNAHVAEKCKSILFTIRESINKLPSYSQFTDVTFNNPHWVFHPKQDLAMLVITGMKETFTKNTGAELYTNSFDESSIIDSSKANMVNIFQEVYMIGYPDGKIDNYNLIPVVRKGICATPFKLNLENTPTYAVDIPIYAGSSGSPIVLVKKDKSYLLGIVSESSLKSDGSPLGIAICIKPDVLQELCNIVKKEGIHPLKFNL